MTVAGKAARKLAKEGNVEGLKDLLRDTSWVDEASRTGFTPLHWASRFGHLGVVKLLLSAGADVNSSNDVELHGRTPLHDASQRGHKEVVLCLLSAGANVNCVNKSGRSPLHGASIHAHLDVVKCLLLAGAFISEEGGSIVHHPLVQYQVRSLFKKEYLWRRRRSFLLFLAENKYITLKSLQCACKVFNCTYPREYVFFAEDTHRMIAKYL